MAKNSMAIANNISIKKIKLLNRYYKITQFYSFLKDTAFKAGLAIVIYVSILLALENTKRAKEIASFASADAG